MALPIVAAHRGAAVTREPAISIIILVTREVSSLLRCLRSVRNAVSAVGQYELIVVANGTSVAALRELYERDDVVLVRSPVNLGFAAGCNLGARHAHGERLVFLNDDVEVTAGWLAGLSDALDGDDRIGVAGSKVILADGRLQEAGSVVWSDGSTSGVGRGRDPDDAAFAQQRYVDYVSFCSAMVRRTAWDQLGGFNDKYFPAYYEDADLCLRMQAVGWRVVYTPASVVHHREGGSSSRAFRDFLSRRNQRLFVRQWRTELRQFCDPPADQVRHAALARALELSSARQTAADGAHLGLAPPHRADQIVDERSDAMLTDEQLSADSAVKDEYIALLEERIARMTLTEVAKRRLYGLFKRPRSC